MDRSLLLWATDGGHTWLPRLPVPAHMHLPLALNASGRKLNQQHDGLPLGAAGLLPPLSDAVELFEVEAIPMQSAKDAAMRKD